MSSLLDQSALTDLASRLVAAARRAGADQADAVAVRSVSLSVDVRDGAVEESQRAESDDVGLRVLVGRRQASISTNDIKGDGVDALAERAIAMARVAPEDKFAGLADPALLAREFPDLDLPSGMARAPSRGSRAWRARREQIRRRLGVGRHRRHGAGDEPRLSRLDARLAAFGVDGGDRRPRHRHGAGLRFLLDAAR
jgi:PmbA protein